MELYDQHQKHLQPVDRFFELIGEPYPEAMHPVDDQIIWTRIILFFLSYGITDDDLRDYCRRHSVPSFDLVPWQNGMSYPKSVAFKRTFVDDMRTLLRTRMD